jgi:signal transduction histidine kinase
LSEDVHALSYRLHPAILHDLGVTEALQSECERFLKICPVQLDMNIEDVTGKLSREVDLCIFRIVQESLRNIARHANASRVEIKLQQLNGECFLTIADDGSGFEPNPHNAKASLGLASMRERVSFLEGRLGVISSQGRGTIVSVWVPMREGQNE